MGLFDNFKQNKVPDTSLTNEELDAMIIDKKKEIESLKKEIEAIKGSIDSVDAKQVEKVKALDEKQAYFEQEIAKQKEKIDEELVKLENKQEAYKADFIKQEEKINQKQRKDFQRQIEQMEQRNKEERISILMNFQEE